MVTFLAVCLRHVWSTRDVAARTVDLELCTVLATNVSNWSLYLEQCPIDLTREQALHLHTSGHEKLIRFLSALLFVFVWVCHKQKRVL